MDVSNETLTRKKRRKVGGEMKGGKQGGGKFPGQTNICRTGHTGRFLRAAFSAAPGSRKVTWGGLCRQLVPSCWRGWTPATDPEPVAEPQPFRP